MVWERDWSGRRRAVGDHTVHGSEERRQWLARLVDGIVNVSCTAVIGPDGIEYQVKGWLRPHLQPGERVRFVPRDGIWRGVHWAAEVHRLRRQPKEPNPPVKGEPENA